MKLGLGDGDVEFSTEPTHRNENPGTMLHLAMDDSRVRLDICVMDESGAILEEHPGPRTVTAFAVVESMNGGPLRP